MRTIVQISAGMGWFPVDNIEMIPLFLLTRVSRNTIFPLFLVASVKEILESIDLRIFVVITKLSST